MSRQSRIFECRHAFIAVSTILYGYKPPCRDSRDRKGLTVDRQVSVATTALLISCAIYFFKVIVVIYRITVIYPYNSEFSVWMWFGAMLADDNLAILLLFQVFPLWVTVLQPIDKTPIGDQGASLSVIYAIFLWKSVSCPIYSWTIAIILWDFGTPRWFRKYMYVVFSLFWISCNSLIDQRRVLRYDCRLSIFNLLAPCQWGSSLTLTCTNWW